MSQDLFILLIEKYLAGQASGQERQLLEEYYKRLTGKDIRVLEKEEATKIEISMLSDMRIKMQTASDKTAQVQQKQSTGPASQKRFAGSSAQKRLTGQASQKELTAQAPQKLFYIPLRGWAAVLLVVFAGIGWFFYKRNGQNGIVRGSSRDGIQQVTTYNNLTVPVGSTPIDTILADGTRIWINSGSTLTWPTAFSSNERPVTLTGEAYFEVVHNARQPFRVKAGATLIEDAGTRFNIRSYGAESDLRVTLLEGSIKVNDTTLAPGQQYSNGKIRSVDTTGIVAWKDAFAKNEVLVFSKFPRQDSLPFQDAFQTAGDEIKALYLLDSSLIAFVPDPGSVGYFFNRYSLNTGMLTNRYVKTGSRGLELAPFSGFYKKNILWLNNMASQQWLTVDLEKNAGHSDTAGINVYSTDSFYYSSQLIHDCKLVASGALHSTHVLQGVDLASGRQIKEFGNLPPAPEGVPLPAWQQAHEGYLFVKPTEEKAVLAFRYTDQVQIFDLHTEKNRLLKGPENYEPAFKLIPSSADIGMVMGRTDKTRMAFQNGFVTDRFIYLLYSGHPDEPHYNPKSKIRGAGKFIFVYDWNGKPVRKFVLDRYITGFTVSEEKGLLYGFDRDKRYIVKATFPK